MPLPGPVATWIKFFPIAPPVRAPFVSVRDREIAAWGNLVNDMFQHCADMAEGSSPPRRRFHATPHDYDNENDYKACLGKTNVPTKKEEDNI